ncbi:sensor histidine kinase [Halobellus rufus]|uniref:sensor histidine kinase n=1 Tax=Halobellus rufus TaxID=1448860 RepID=UPI002F35349D
MPQRRSVGGYGVPREPRRELQPLGVGSGRTDRRGRGGRPDHGLRARRHRPASSRASVVRDGQPPQAQPPERPQRHHGRRGTHRRRRPGNRRTNGGDPPHGRGAPRERRKGTGDHRPRHEARASGTRRPPVSRGGRPRHDRRRFGAGLVETGPIESCTVRARAELCLCVVELLENAIRHSERADPFLRVSARCADGVATITVEDDGAPIPPIEADVLEGNHEMNDVYHSSGLGFWLVYWCVELSGGSIAVDSGAQSGNAISIRLPNAVSPSTS